jgi:hypothetical protein
VHALDGLLALIGVGLQQIENHRRILARADGAHTFRVAAREHVAAQPLARDELAGGMPHGLQPHQAEGEARRQLVAGGLVLMSFFPGQQQLGFEKRQPGRHHQIVGSQLQPGFQRLVDEFEVLLCQRQHGDLGKIHLLRARQRQEQVERALEALQIDDQRFAGARGVVGIGPPFERGLGACTRTGLWLLIRCDHLQMHSA